MKKCIFVILLFMASVPILAACGKPEPPIPHGIRYKVQNSARFNIDGFTGLLLDEWFTVNDYYSRYEVRFSVSVVRTRECGPYGFEPLDSTLYYKAVGIEISIYDLEAETEVATSPVFEGGAFPTTCPKEHEFETRVYGGVEMPQDDTEWRAPKTVEVEAWLKANMEDLPFLFEPPPETE